MRTPLRFVLFPRRPRVRASVCYETFLPKVLSKLRISGLPLKPSDCGSAQRSYRDHFAGCSRKKTKAWVRSCQEGLIGVAVKNFRHNLRDFAFSHTQRRNSRCPLPAKNNFNRAIILFLRFLFCKNLAGSFVSAAVLFGSTSIPRLPWANSSPPHETLTRARKCRYCPDLRDEPNIMDSRNRGNRHHSRSRRKRS